MCLLPNEIRKANISTWNFAVYRKSKDIVCGIDRIDGWKN